jgi:hypothetical protein
MLGADRPPRGSRESTVPPRRPLEDLDPSPADLVLDPAPAPGWIAPDVAEELPGLELLSWTTATEWRRRSPPWAREWLGRLSTGVDGHAVLHAHRTDAPAAHRDFLRRIGRDPNVDLSPQELAYHDRILHGGFPVRGTPQDLLLVVLLETGIPIWVLDADRISGDLGIRRSLLGELPEEASRPAGAPPRRPEPVVVDGSGVVAEIGREPREPWRATRKTTSTTFFCARVPGLPDLRVEEAIWLCRSLVDRAR